jgi:choline dehydrogenase
VKVLLLEAGKPDTWRSIHLPDDYYDVKGSNPDVNSNVLWQFVTQPNPKLKGRRINWPRGKTLGGSSSINAMLYIRGNQADYNHWVQMGNAGWSYLDVLPFFKRSEDNERGASEYHGVAGPLSVINFPRPNDGAYAFIEAAKECGYPASYPLYDFNGQQQMNAAGFYQLTVINDLLLRCSTAASFLALSANRQNLTFLTDVLVGRILIEAGRALGVEFSSGGVVQKAYAAREVLVSAGAIQSPQLLMLSGVGPRDQLKNLGIEVAAHLPGVGQNLIDHPIVWPEFQSTVSLLPMFASGVVGGLFINVHDASASVPDLQFHFQTEQILDGTFGYSFGLTLVAPKSVGHLSLQSSDPAAPPHIFSNYLSEPSDLEVLVRGFKMTRDLTNTRAFASIGNRELSPGAKVKTDDQIRDYIRDNLTTIYHPVGTCKMGSDDHAVVDSSLRVHGLKGLRVVDASIMPMITRGNTNAPTIMIAEKLAAMLRGQEARVLAAETFVTTRTTSQRRPNFRHP